MRVRVGSRDLIEQLRRLPVGLTDARIEWVADDRIAPQSEQAEEVSCDAVVYEEYGWLVLRMGDEPLPAQPGGALPAHALAAVGFAGEMLESAAAEGASRAIDLDGVRVHAVAAIRTAQVETASGGRA